MVKASSMKSQRTKQALWSKIEVFLAAACIILPKVSAKVDRATSYSEGCSERKSRRSMISRFSAMSRAELLDGSGRAAADASAPASTSSKVMDGGSAEGCL